VVVRFLAGTLALSTAALAAGQSCTLYATGFDAFSGPPNLDQGPFRVAWCLDGAAVTSFNACPSGNALKLDAAGEDPVLLVRVGDAGCATVTLTFRYGQFVPTGTVVRAAFTSATEASCAAATPITLGPLAAVGACATASFTVDMDGAQGILFRFDHGANANALTVDDVSVVITGCCGATHGCCATGSPGCAEAAVAACVCAVDPYCCAVEWDVQCVEEVDSLGCGSCQTTAECATGFATDFGTLYLTGPICERFPELFETCEGSPPNLTISGGCAGSGDPAMRFGTGIPYSAAISRCLDLTAVPGPRLRFRYSRDPGTLGPRLDYRVADGPWLVGWQPASGEGTSGCTAVELDLGPLAGESEVRFRFVSGSSVSNGARIDDIELVPGDPAHGCCMTGGPGCAEPTVEACVCGLDSYCCDVAWDLACVQSAVASCGASCAGVPVCGASDAGSCFEAGSTPHCADAACCLAVCSLDAFCCVEAWDATCANEAAQICDGAGCGPGLPPCGTPHPQPGCSAPDCCRTVCVADPVCCMVAWDAPCAAAAAAVCAAPPADLDGDGRVDAVDLTLLLGAWGSSGPGDLDSDGTVAGGDLAALLAAWSP
jgi:hypothetical protein